MNNGLAIPIRNLGIALFFVYVISVITGCAHHTESPRYFVLSPIKETVLLSESDPSKKYIIGVGPIKLPKYLSRSQIVRFSGENEIVLEDYNRWAEPVEQNFMRVLRINLTRLLESSYAIGYPWERTVKPRLQVMLDVHQFETAADGTVSLNAHWTIFDLSKNKNIKIVRKFIYSNKLDKINYSNIVAQKSKALEYLSQDISKEIKKLLDQRETVGVGDQVLWIN